MKDDMRKVARTISVSKYIDDKIKKYSGDGEGKIYASPSNMAEIALAQLVYRLEAEA